MIALALISGLGGLNIVNSPEAAAFFEWTGEKIEEAREGNESYKDINFEALAAAYGTIEGNYSSYGSYVCDRDGNCGRGLGRYQYMSYRQDVRKLLSATKKGRSILAAVDAGMGLNELSSSHPLDKVFTPKQQDELFRGAQKRNIEQAIAEGMEGDRIIERIGQIHFGGPGSTIDGGASDIHNRLSLKTYGKKLKQNYFLHCRRVDLIFFFSIKT